jgi:hypothetical protein
MAAPSSFCAVGAAVLGGRGERGGASAASEDGRYYNELRRRRREKQCALQAFNVLLLGEVDDEVSSEHL